MRRVGFQSLRVRKGLVVVLEICGARDGIYRRCYSNWGLGIVVGEEMRRRRK